MVNWGQAFGRIASFVSYGYEKELVCSVAQEHISSLRFENFPMILVVGSKMMKLMMTLG